MRDGSVGPSLFLCVRSLKPFVRTDYQLRPALYLPVAASTCGA